MRREVLVQRVDVACGRRRVDAARARAVASNREFVAATAPLKTRRTAWSVAASSSSAGDESPNAAIAYASVLIASWLLLERRRTTWVPSVLRSETFNEPARSRRK